MSNPYNIAVYMRISKEDGAENESNSISNQRKLIKNYIESHPHLLAQNITEYFDDGLTGVNFDRPQFSEMLRAVQNKSCNCIVVKDFSRLGRNYIEVSDYLEQIFPFLGVRFISINDNFDSISDQYNIRMDVSFKNLIHDYYIKDLSQKVRSAFQTKMLNGSFVSSSAFFGYKIFKDGVRKLEIDEYSSLIVKRIFEMVAQGFTTTEIAKIFNAESIPTPSKYRKQFNKYLSTKENFWRNGLVYEIVTDERYTGKGIFKKKEKLEIASNKYKELPKDKWIVVPKSHPPIISEELYQKALHCLKYPKAKESDTKKQRVLYAKVRCHCCDYSMKRTSQKKAMYYCETPKYIVSPDCVTEHISEIDIETVLITTIQTKINLVLEEQKAKELIKKSLKIAKVDVITKMKQLEISINNFNNLKFKVYEQYTGGKVTKDNFKKLKVQYDNQIQNLKTQLDECKLAKEDEDEEEDNSYTPFYKFIKNKQQITELSREMVDTLVDKIIVFDKQHFEIVWKFKDIFMQ